MSLLPRPPRRLLLVVAAVCLLVGATLIGVDRRPASAFGSVKIVGTKQRVVHEPITRTLGCGADDPVTNCFESISLSMLAGRSGTFGAVGEPDNPLDGSPNPAARHCDDIDYGYGSTQRKDEAQVEFNKCLEWYQAYMDFAVESAGRLLRADGTIDPAQTDIVNGLGGTYNACKLPDPKKGNTSDYSAKCGVLNGLGRALHNYEDIWSHSNWGDRADPGTAIGLANPGGLGNTAQPPFMAYPGPIAAPIPENFLSGCDDSLPLSPCTTVFGTLLRTPHSVLNKDNGTVDARTCTASDPLTDRGKVTISGVTNFQRAVTGACGAARRAWSDLRAALAAKYGPTRAATMIRAITFDNPLTDCRVSGSAARASSPPVGNVPSARSVTITVINRTSQPLACGDAVLDGGEWASYPADSIAPGARYTWRTQSNGFMTGTEGRATFRAGAGPADFTVSWNNPYWGSNSYSCGAPAGFRCDRSGGGGNDSAITVTFSGP